MRLRIGKGLYPIACFYLNRSDTPGAYVCSKVGETDPNCFCENYNYMIGTRKKINIKIRI